MPNKTTFFHNTIVLITLTQTAFFAVASIANAFTLFPGFSTNISTPKVHTALSENIAQNQAKSLEHDIHKMAKILFANLKEPDPEIGDLGDGITMSSFVELKKLSRTSSLGRYLAEQLMTEFQHHGYKVIELRKSTSVSIQEKRGEYGLSRNISQINQQVEARTMVTGTYTIAGDKIMVNARVLDNKDASLLSSATILLSKNTLTDLLLSDAASASPRKNEVTYMKRLEL